MSEKVHKVTEAKVRNLIMEAIVKAAAKQEFHPVKGPNVDAEDKKINQEGVNAIMSDIEKNTIEPTRKEGEIRRDYDWNRNLVDLDFNEGYGPSKEWLERSEANIHGFPSADNEKTSDMKNSPNLSFEGNKAIADDMKFRSDRRKERERDRAEAGLTGHNLKKYKQRKDMAPMNEDTQRVRFANTKFLNEADVIKHVPEEFKKNEGRFFMTDSTNTDYIVECRIDPMFNMPILSVEGKLNGEVFNEEIDRMKTLIGHDVKNGVAKSIKGQSISEMRNILDIVKNV